MEYTYLGRSGLQVSRLALGTMNFGMETSEADSFAILDEALESGINFVDTADVYGGPQSPDIAQGYGISEEIMGRWLAQGGRREQIVLATKGDGHRPQRSQALGLPHPEGLRGQPPALADPTTSISTRCTTSTAGRPWRRSGRRWRNWSARAR
jgi:aryl-alcohol dehydrogenase-like predicted oxidoreductase